MRRAYWAIAALLIVGPTSAEVEVQPASVRVRASGVPLAEILAQLSRAARFELKYDGPPPTTRVHLDFEARSPTEAIQRLMEASGLGWAARFDTSGGTVECLLVGQPASATARTTTSSARTPPPPLPPEEEQEPLAAEPGNSDPPAQPAEEASANTGPPPPASGASSLPGPGLARSPAFSGIGWVQPAPAPPTGASLP